MSLTCLTLIYHHHRYQLVVILPSHSVQGYSQGFVLDSWWVIFSMLVNLYQHHIFGSFRMWLELVRKNVCLKKKCFL